MACIHKGKNSSVQETLPVMDIIISRVADETSYTPSYLI